MVPHFDQFDRFRPRVDAGYDLTMENSVDKPELGDDLAFEPWVCRVFEHPVTDPEWYFGDRTDPWATEARMVLGYLTRLFEAPEFLMSAYSRPQVGQGLWYLVSGIGSGYMFFLHDAVIPWSVRYRTISSIPVLFQRLFANECGDALGHLDKKGDDLLSMTCYMWWDIFPTMPEKPDQRLAEAFLEAMANLLSLPSEACQESGLHGLGHEECRAPERVREIVDEFLEGNPGVSPELRQYALNAREGHVL